LNKLMSSLSAILRDKFYITKIENLQYSYKQYFKVIYKNV